MPRVLWVISVAMMYAGPLLASTSSTAIFCQKYPKAADCSSQQASCNVCHAGPPSLNAYGEDLKGVLSGPIDNFLLEALDKVEGVDSDEDGASNLDEITHGGAPGNRNVRPVTEAKITYDPAIALRRLKAVYCGSSVSFAENEALKAAADPKAYLHERLSECLSSPYWKQEALQRLADKKIQPLAAIGFGGNVVIADYRWDYRLFAYVMSDDRDVRELLSATYHVDEAGNKVEGVIARQEQAQVGQRIVIGGGQPLAANRRAGMITTQWFLANNTMFSILPRNTASQAYREYLGLDIAKGEGLMPVANEPRDVDNRRVKAPDCAVCHSTLDPLSYAFSTYVGIDPIRAFLANANGTYSAGRAPWEAQGQILGQPTMNLLQWAELARNSDAFKKNIAHMMFYQALSREPMPHEKKEFEALWQELDTDNYSVNKMLHRFIETSAFGGRKS